MIQYTRLITHCIFFHTASCTVDEMSMHRKGMGFLFSSQMNKHVLSTLSYWWLGEQGDLYFHDSVPGGALSKH